jgi:hypothetical protein
MMALRAWVWCDEPHKEGAEGAAAAASAGMDRGVHTIAPSQLCVTASKPYKHAALRWWKSKGIRAHNMQPRLLDWFIPTRMFFVPNVCCLDLPFKPSSSSSTCVTSHSPSTNTHTHTHTQPHHHHATTPHFRRRPRPGPRLPGPPPGQHSAEATPPFRFISPPPFRPPSDPPPAAAAATAAGPRH